MQNKRSSGTCRLLYRVCVVKENIEILKLWKSQGIIFLKLLKSERGLGNSFSANLRCLNFENVWESTPPGPLKILESLVTIQGGSAEKSWKSSVILLKIFCIHPVIYMLFTYISCVHIKGFTVMHYSHWLSSTIARAADLSPEGSGFESH